jgi:hypothetical protein
MQGKAVLSQAKVGVKVAFGAVKHSCSSHHTAPLSEDIVATKLSVDDKFS